MKINLIAYTIGEKFGGEGLKAYQYAKNLKERDLETIIFTHARSIKVHPDLISEFNIKVIDDTLLQRILWQSIILRYFLPIYFHISVRKVLLKNSCHDEVDHYITPISPVTPRFAIKKRQAILGPVSGAIYYPPKFQHRAPLSYMLKEVFHYLSQRLSRYFIQDFKRFDKILVSGYDRTKKSLVVAGYNESSMIEVVDSGIKSSLFSRQPIIHKGESTRFVFVGRLVDYKGLDLAIRAISLCRCKIELCVIGDGPKIDWLRSLADSLELGHSVTFRGWLEHDELLRALEEFRALVFPSLAEANGIVIQEAMSIGLPVIALKWGGPDGLMDESCGIMIDPSSEEEVIRNLAHAMDRLASDADLANKLSEKARSVAMSRFSWPDVASSWIASYSVNHGAQKQ